MLLSHEEGGHLQFAHVEEPRLSVQLGEQGSVVREGAVAHELKQQQ